MGYGVATVRRIDKIIGLSCRISSLVQGSFAKETYNLIDPTNRSHPMSVFLSPSIIIVISIHVITTIYIYIYIYIYFIYIYIYIYIYIFYIYIYIYIYISYYYIYIYICICIHCIYTYILYIHLYTHPFSIMMSKISVLYSCAKCDS